MTTDQKGAIAEAAIALEALKLGIEVYRPIAEGGRFDMILVVDGRLLRVQCKWAMRYEEVVVVRCYSNRRARTGDFDFAATLGRHQGAVAQLGERRAGSA
jgi:PD-(D/E)XK nuclease superfamily protein